jgi:hypothetical protein
VQTLLLALFGPFEYPARAFVDDVTARGQLAGHEPFAESADAFHDQSLALPGYGINRKSHPREIGRDHPLHDDADRRNSGTSRPEYPV